MNSVERIVISVVKFASFARVYTSSSAPQCERIGTPGGPNSHDRAGLEQVPRARAGFFEVLTPVATSFTCHNVMGHNSFIWVTNVHEYGSQFVHAEFVFPLVVNLDRLTVIVMAEENLIVS